MLRRVLIVAVLIAGYQKWPEIKALLAPAPERGVAQAGEVVLYSTAWCGYCEKARTLMRSHGIDFVELDVETSAEGRRQHQQLGGGGVPVLLIDGEVVRGYAPQRILELAAQR
jgi:mycoredoxin